MAAQNYGLDKQIDHDLRYDRADEWVDVVRKLWRSWDRDAVLEDTANGVFADFTKVRPINHDGRFFQVRGPRTPTSRSTSKFSRGTTSTMSSPPRWLRARLPTS